MPTGNAIQTATIVSGGGGSSTGTSTVTIALLDATGTVNVGNATAPGAAGSVLTSSDATDAIWSTTTGTVGSAGVAGFATNAGTATTSGFATNAGTSTIAGNAGTATVSGTATVANALNASGGTVNVAEQSAPAAAGSVLTATTAGVSGTATVSNAWAHSAGTMNTSGAANPVSSGSVYISASATTGTWGVVTAAAAAPPGTACGSTSTGTGFKSASSATLKADIGPSLSVAANYVGAGTTYNVFGVINGTGTAGAPVSMYAALVWGGTGGVILTNQATVLSLNGNGAGGTAYFNAYVTFESTSVAQVSYLFNGTGTVVGTTVTGLTTTSGETFTFLGSMSLQGTATATIGAFQAQIIQVH